MAQFEALQRALLSFIWHCLFRQSAGEKTPYLIFFYEFYDTE